MSAHTRRRQIKPLSQQMKEEREWLFTFCAISLPPPSLYLYAWTSLFSLSCPLYFFLTHCWPSSFSPSSLPLSHSDFFSFFPPSFFYLFNLYFSPSLSQIRFQTICICMKRKKTCVAKAVQHLMRVIPCQSTLETAVCYPDSEHFYF